VRAARVCRKQVFDRRLSKRESSLIGFSRALSAALFLAVATQAGAQAPAPSAAPATTQQTAADSIGSVASLQGSATVTRNNATAGLKLNDDIFKGDLVQTAGNATLGITLDDETTFTMGADARMVMDEFLYQKSGKNAGAYQVLRGTVAFVAGQVAKTGNMTINTPTATFGIRGTTGVVEVPEGVTTAGQVAIKLYPDANGIVGRIEVFAPGTGGARLGILTRASSGFGIGAAVAGRFAAVPLVISPQQVARDRGFVRQLFSHATIGRRNVIERRNVRQRALPQNLQRQNLPRNLQRQNVPQNLQRQNLQQPLPRQNLQRPTLQGVPQPGLQQPRFNQPLPALRQPPTLQGAPALRRPPQQLPSVRPPPDRRNQPSRQLPR
jgi:hypothetical protein